MRKTIYTLALLLACSVLSAQNLNPVVEVTNSYESGRINAEKPALEIAVPDSVLRFKLNFDYSSLNKPYQGAYEFRPYLVELRPQAPVSTERRFYLRAGAGYSIHPELELVVTPVLKDNFRLNIFADHNSYFGYYKTIARQDKLISPNGEKWAGGDMGNRIGVDGVYSYGSGKVDFGMGYDNAYNSLPTAFNRGFYGLTLGAGVKCLDPNPSLYYDASLKIRTGTHVQRWESGEKDRMANTRFLFDGGLGIPVGEGMAMLNAAVIMDSMSIGSVTRLRAVPHYIFDWGDVNFDLGVKVEGTFRSRSDFFPGKAGVIFPEVHVNWKVLDDDMVIQGAATGGNYLSTPYDLMEESRFLAIPLLSDKWDVSVERLRLMLGVRGNLSEFLGYDVQFGYARWNNARVSSFNLSGGELPYTLGYADLNLFFADLSLNAKFGPVQFEGQGKFNYAKVDVREVMGPARFTSGMKLFYDWGGRIQAGVGADMSTTRRMISGDGTVLTLPGWWDLGVYGAYAWTRNFGFWIKGGNLLGQNIQRVPGICEKGMYFTAGIRLNF